MVVIVSLKQKQEPKLQTPPTPPQKWKDALSIQERPKEEEKENINSLHQENWCFLFPFRRNRKSPVELPLRWNCLSKDPINFK